LHPDVSRLRRSLNGEKLAIGVDRLDYSKGLIKPHRSIRPHVDLAAGAPAHVSLLQIATPSRGAIEAYGNLQNELAKLVSDVNGRHGEVDWTPIRYLNKGYSQTVLAGLYRTAQVGVVTPLHDGMNLVAKEYVAAQNPADPGVLVLSKFAGAAKPAGYGALGQSARYRRHGADDRDRALDAPDRAAHALGSHDDKTPRRHDPAMVCRFRRCAAGKLAAGEPLRQGEAEPLMAEAATLVPLRSVNTGARYHDPN